MPKSQSLNPVDKHIGSRIRMRRNELRISQEKLGEAVGLTFQQIQKYEKGVNGVRGSRMAQIARVLQVDVEFFYQGAPGSNGRNAPVTSTMDDFVATQDGLTIARAFVRIKNPVVRNIIARSIMRLSEALAS